MKTAYKPKKRRIKRRSIVVKEPFSEFEREKIQELIDIEKDGIEIEYQTFHRTDGSIEYVFDGKTIRRIELWEIKTKYDMCH